jgi:iron-sulfur cluster repair protein YtfE (RIC family)
MEIARDRDTSRQPQPSAELRKKTWTSVSACLEHDHRVLDAIVADVEGFVQGRDLVVAAEYFALFRRRLEAHIDAEETLLFPFFERATSRNGPTSVMRREHGDIRQVMSALSAALAGGEKSPSGPCGCSCSAKANPLALLDELKRVLESHNEKEERVLYPAIDANAAIGGELTELVGRVEACLERGNANGGT